jgi:hypothetical protein
VEQENGVRRKRGEESKTEKAWSQWKKRHTEKETEQTEARKA